MKFITAVAALFAICALPAHALVFMPMGVPEIDGSLVFQLAGLGGGLLVLLKKKR